MDKFDKTICYINEDAIIRKANKAHECNLCYRGIRKNDLYFSYKSAAYIVWWDDFEEKKIVERHYVNDKYCFRCNYKTYSHNIRAKKRRNNCPDEDFQFVWNGGWCDGAPDGGDGQFECHKCNLICR